MTSTNRQLSVALLGLAALAVSRPVAKADDPPEAPGVSIRKVTVTSGLTQTVHYVVTGGSPRLQALVRRIEWAENELSVVEQLQLLKREIVVNERRVAAARTAQLTSPFYQPGYLPPCIPANTGSVGDSPLQRGLQHQLAFQATPDAALNLIGFLENLETDLNAELKALPPPEKKVGQEPLNALRQRVAALPHGAESPPQPAGPRDLSGPSSVDPAQRETAGRLPVAAGAKAAIEVEWGGTWYAAEVMAVNGGQSRIHYTGWASSWDEWVPASRIRPAGTITTPPTLYCR